MSVGLSKVDHTVSPEEFRRMKLPESVSRAEATLRFEVLEDQRGVVEVAEGRRRRSPVGRRRRTAEEVIWAVVVADQIGIVE